jgi:N6-adenosine-specific RNA methylase IME4
LRTSQIKLGARHRRDLGDIESLARSISDVGLLHPIVVRSDDVLVAGERRLAAVRQLGWAEVPVTIIDLHEIVRGEFAENSQRKDFLPSEIDSIRRALEPIEKAAAKERQGARNDLCESFTQVGKQRAADKIGSFAGVSGRTVEKIKDVVEAAEADPDRFGHLIEEMDRTGKVTGAYRKLRQAKDEQRIQGITPLIGKFRTLVVDPPWDYEWLSLAGRAAPGYATMTHEQLLDLNIAQWAEENCHLYLWTTNNFMTRAVDLMAHWGFAHKTVLTWVKPRWGLGSYFRNSTEHVLFGIRGELRTRSDNIATHFEASLGQHSEKPEEFYEIVRRASYEPYGECFQRQPRPDFTNVFIQEAQAAE